MIHSSGFGFSTRFEGGARKEVTHPTMCYISEGIIIDHAGLRTCSSKGEIEHLLSQEEIGG